MEETGVHCRERFVAHPALRERAARAARGYAELGVGAGDRVALLLRNDLPFLEASFGAAALGAIPVPINWHWKADEVGYLLSDCGARALVVHDDLWPGVADALPPALPVIAVETSTALASAYGLEPGAGRSPADAPRWEDWLAGLRPWDQPPERAPHSMIYTSGTTGRPKGVIRRPQPEEAAAATQEMLERVFRLMPGQRTLIPAPMYHTAPNVVALAAAARELEVVVMPRFDPEEFLALVQAHGITTVQMVPTMFVRLLALPEEVRARYDLSSLEWVVHAAAPCPPEVKRAMIDWLGPIVTEYYGGTETGAVTFCDSPEWLAHPGTVGRPLPGANVRILDDAGRERPAGETGEVYMWLDSWPDFTYHGDEDKRRAVERDGLISCGDLGYLDQDGFLHLNDRRSDMVISGGVNVYPAEIEACLLGLRGVRDCAVFGIPDDRFGEALAAYVAGDDLDAPTVRAHLAARLAGYKVPRVIEFRDELPREDSGKIFKRLLREPYWAGRERRIS